MSHLLLSQEWPPVRGRLRGRMFIADGVWETSAALAWMFRNVINLANPRAWGGTPQGVLLWVRMSETKT